MTLPCSVVRGPNSGLLCAGRLSRVDVLAMVGSSAALICVVQAAVLKHCDWACSVINELLES